MGFIRRAVRFTGLVLTFVLMAPAVALLPAAFLDLGPGGTVRPTLFPFALATLDPFVRMASLNSLLGASVVTLGSTVLGVELARIMTGRRFWGRRLMAGLALSPVIATPLFVALGLRGLFEGRLLVGGSSTPGVGLGWLCWVWAEMVRGIPLVALATAAALERVEPAWIDAARLTGASRFRIWWELVWPPVRSSAFKAAGVVFSLTLVEPGVPIVLGLRRTLAFQIVEATLGPDPLPRAAILAIEAVALALLGRFVLGGLGGRVATLPAGPPRARAEDLRWPHALLPLAFMATIAALAWLPIGTLVASAFAPSIGGSRWAVSAFWHRLDQAEAGPLFANSLALGLGVLAINMLTTRARPVRAGRNWFVARLATRSDAFPPLSIGVGALALGWLCHLAVLGLRLKGGPQILIAGCEAVREVLDPLRSPGVLLLLAVAAAGQATLRQAWQGFGGGLRDRLTDVAITLGASERQAQHASRAGWLGIPPALLILTLVLAATSLSPALILAPTLESRPITPGLLILADEPGEAQSTAAALATCVIAVRLAAFGLAALLRDRSEPIGGWLRARS